MNPKLLIVDDDEEIRTQMKWALAKDYEILVAEDRASAVEIFQDGQPSVVLLDLGLPPHPGNPEEGLATLSELLALDRLAKDCHHHRPGRKGNRAARHRRGRLRFSVQAGGYGGTEISPEALFPRRATRTGIPGDAAIAAGRCL